MTCERRQPHPLSRILAALLLLGALSAGCLAETDDETPAEGEGEGEEGEGEGEGEEGEGEGEGEEGEGEEGEGESGSCEALASSRACLERGGCFWSVSEDDRLGPHCDGVDCDELVPGRCVPEPCELLSEASECRVREGCVWWVELDASSNDAESFCEGEGCQDPGRCVPTPCEDLDAAGCDARPDCELLGQGGSGDGAPAAPAREPSCVPTLPEDCEARSPGACLADESCRLVEEVHCLDTGGVPVDETEDGEEAEPKRLDCELVDVCRFPEPLPEDCLDRSLDECADDGRCRVFEEEICWEDNPASGQRENPCELIQSCEPLLGAVCEERSAELCEADRRCLMLSLEVCHSGNEGELRCADEPVCSPRHPPQGCEILEPEGCMKDPRCEPEWIPETCDCDPAEDEDCFCPPVEYYGGCFDVDSPCTGLDQETCSERAECRPLFELIPCDCDSDGGPCDCPEGAYLDCVRS